MDKNTIWAAQSAGGEPPFLEEAPLWEDHERRSMRCRACHLPRVFRRRKTRHPLHFVLSIGTLGLWLPIWGILILLQALQPWTCTVCGIHQRNPAGS